MIFLTSRIVSFPGYDDSSVTHRVIFFSFSFSLTHFSPFYSKITEINPNHPYAYSNRARVKCKSGDYQGAIYDYSKSIEIEPNNHFAYQFRADVKRKLGDNESADEDDRKAETLKNIF